MSRLIRSIVLGFTVLFLVVAAYGQALERSEPLPRKPSFGAQLAPATAEEMKPFGREAKPGLKVVRVLPNQTAEALSLREGDILLQFDGVEIATVQQLNSRLRTLESGRPVSASIGRAGQVVGSLGTLRERPRQVEEGLIVDYDQVVSLGKRIRVISVRPPVTGPFPTVFLIGGIGGYSIDGPFSGTPYGNVLGPLARAGYAIVRLDKPGQGDSEGPEYPDLDFDTELDAYRQALRLTKALPYVDPKRLAIFGHSMGGCFAPELINSESIPAVAVSGTLAKTWTEYQLENTRRQMLLSGANAAEVDRQMKQLAAAAYFLFDQGKSIADIKSSTPELTPILNALSPDGKTMSGVGIRFFQQLAKKNLAEGWQEYEGKVLALWGESEFISTRWDHEYIAQIVNKRRPGQAEFRALPQSDHGFNLTASTEDSFVKWGRPGATFNPNVIDALKEWLAKLGS
jgi:hypothetical protein